MGKAPKSPGELEKVLLLKRKYPNLYYSYFNEMGLRGIAGKLKEKETQENGFFSDYNETTLVKYIRWAIKGFEYEGLYYDGLVDEEVYEDKSRQIQTKKVENMPPEERGLKSWTKQEENYVLNLYKQGVPPKKIHQYHNSQEEFPERSFFSIENLINGKRREGHLDYVQRINWDEDIGFAAMALVARYGREKNFLSENAKILDEFYFDGEGKITKQRLNNFYRRNNQELQEILEENGHNQ